jgi:hypothetical protein
MSDKKVSIPEMTISNTGDFNIISNILVIKDTIQSENKSKGIIIATK